jgi:YD repeat-containing protein
LAGTDVITNTYDLADELSGTASTQGNTTYSYDGNGNQTASYGITGVVTNTYNDLEQLTNVVGPGTNVSYVYDGQGDRLRSYEQSGTTPVLYNDAQDLAGGLSDLVNDGTDERERRRRCPPNGAALSRGVIDLGHRIPCAAHPFASLLSAPQGTGAVTRRLVHRNRTQPNDSAYCLIEENGAVYFR